jgi:hypothetical protein
MNWMLRTRSFPLGLALTVPLLILPAMAALGGDATSVQQDASQFKAQIRVTQKQAYVVHELHTSGGAMVREYISPAGRVFGVAWQGPVMPDLQQVLGAYYERFAATAQEQRRRGVHGPVGINESGLVLQSGGHMRAYTGKAYIPEMLPEGVRADAIQ